MRVHGSFTTLAAPADLRATVTSAAELAQVPTLHDIELIGPDRFAMVFTPQLTMGPVPLATLVTKTSDRGDQVEFDVVGSRAGQSVAVVLVLTMRESEGATTVNWTADVVVRGSVASIGQRVIGHLATRAIDDVLVGIASVAAGSRRA